MTVIHSPNLTFCGYLNIKCYQYISFLINIYSRIFISVIALSIMYDFFPCGAYGKEPVCQCRRQEMQVQSLGQEDSWRRKWELTLVFLSAECYEQRSLVGYSLLGCTSWTWLKQLSSAHNTCIICIQPHCFH